MQATGRIRPCSVKARVNKKVLSLGLKNRQSRLSELFVAASSRQTELKIGMEKSVLVNGWTIRGMADERKVRLQTRSVIRSILIRTTCTFDVCLFDRFSGVYSSGMILA